MISTSKSYISFFKHINEQEILMHYDSKEIHAKNIVTDCVVRSELRIDILNAR